ncbi:MAG: hypothetical protein IT158_03840, partial [Bryobacterales bacterium]|nr:hypothetical protein [Bryobacterales bacterium]
MGYYRFPFLLYQLRPGVMLGATLISAGAAAAGTLYSVIRASLVPPAVGMQPEPPARDRVSIVERIGLRRWLAQPTRMIVRNLERRPVKAALSAVGVAFACAILITGGFFNDAVDYMVDVQFKLAQQDDIAVTFHEVASTRALSSLRSLPGVRRAEGYRSVPARLRHEHRTYRTSLNGMPQDGVLRRLLNRELRPVALPPDGVVLTDHLAEILDIRPGEILTVEVLEGSRPVRTVPVAGVVSEYVGVAGYMRLPALQRLMREGPSISGAYLSVDSARMEEVYARLKEMPRVAGAAVREKALQNFYETMANQVLVF